MAFWFLDGLPSNLALACTTHQALKTGIHGWATMQHATANRNKVFSAPTKDPDRVIAIKSEARLVSAIVTYRVINLVVFIGDRYLMERSIRQIAILLVIARLWIITMS